jgi:myo-inositol-1-phosphate synthase
MELLLTSFKDNIKVIYIPKNQTRISEITDRLSMQTSKIIRIAIAGVGNCASSLMQGIQFYSTNDIVYGLMHKEIGGYAPSAIEVVGAIDVDRRKVGKELSEALLAEPNCTKVFADVPQTGITVVKGPVLDGVAPHMTDRFLVDEAQESVDVVAWLRSIEADFLICYLPVGSEKAARFYADAAIEAGVGFINAIPVFICSTPEYDARFAAAGLVCAGDDIKSQFGATYLNRLLVEHMIQRGFSIDDLYQLNVGGNTDFENMIDESRLSSKRVSKTSAVRTVFDDFELRNEPALRIGPSDYVPHLKDTKICYINVRGRQFGDVPFELELKLTVQDSPNSAGVMMDVIRMLKVAKDRGMAGTVQEVSSYGFKHPAVNVTETEVYRRLDLFLGEPVVHLR